MQDMIIIVERVWSGFSGLVNIFLLKFKLHYQRKKGKLYHMWKIVGNATFSYMTTLEIRMVQRKLVGILVAGFIVVHVTFNQTKTVPSYLLSIAEKAYNW